MDEDKDDISFGEPELDETEEKEKSNCNCCCIFIFVIFLLIVVLAIVVFFYLRNKSTEKNWDNAYGDAKLFVSQLNLTEKIGLLYGTENLRFRLSNLPKKINYTEKAHLCVGQIDAFENNNIEFPGMCLQDGPTGIRFADGTGISWQSPINTAATFNKELMYEIGKSQGEESKIRGVNTFLSPCVNIMRTPQGGRLWEGFGEDPYLTGIAGAQVIKGIQDAGVIATVKHFLGNEQETYRKASSSNIGLQALMDIYVEPFYRAVKADVGAVMCSYNAVNNTYACENEYLLTQVLRKMLKFRGFVMSDWWAIYNNDSQSFNSGTDMNMPGGVTSGLQYVGRNGSFWSNFEQYIKEKKITEERITEAATRIIATMHKLDQIYGEKPFPKVDLYRETKDDKRRMLHRKAATESIVLLKNDGILPLKDYEKIAVIGNEAFERDCMTGDENNQCKNKTNEVQNGHIPMGYGSGTTAFGYMVTPYDALKEISRRRGIELFTSKNLYYIDQDRNGTKVHVQAIEDIKGGEYAASQAEIALVFVGVTSGEDSRVENTIGDRPNLDLWHGADELIEKVVETNENTIVIINGPSVVNMPWMDKVKAIVFAGFPGAESGHAIVDILFGIENPSGHLPYVWGKLEDYGAKITHLNNYTIVEGTNKTWKDVYRYDGIDSVGLKDDLPGHDMEQYNYTEGLYVGQRWFNKNNKTAIFPFGFGLSYSKFNYSELKLSMDKEGLKATFKIKNKSEIAGKAVPMMFITFPDNIGEYPKHILKGFDKFYLNANETRTESILADDHALSYFNIKKNDYVRVNKGKIKVCIAENGDPNQCLINGEIDASF